MPDTSLIIINLHFESFIYQNLPIDQVKGVHYLIVYYSRKVTHKAVAISGDERVGKSFVL